MTRRAQSSVLLLVYRKRSVAIDVQVAISFSKMVPTPDSIAMVEKRLRPGRLWPKCDWIRLTSLVDYVSPHGVNCRHEYILVIGGYDGIQFLQLILFLNAVPHSWNQLVIYTKRSAARPCCRRCAFFRLLYSSPL